MSDRDILKSTLATTSECLAPEQLEALLDGRQSNPHLASCPRCQAELAMLKSFESGTPLPDEGAAVAWISSHLDRQLEAIKNPSRGRTHAATNAQGSWLARTFGLKPLQWALPATAVLAAAIVGIVLLRPPKEPELQANAGGQSTIYRSQEVQVVGPTGDISKLPKQLEWRAFPSARNYRVVVMEVDKSEIWSTETKEVSVEIPSSVRVKMLPGKPILWRVAALDSGGRVLGTSQIQRITIPRLHSSEAVQSR
jgi:hypothetical protein